MVTIDDTSATPPYEQVRAQLAGQITNHVLVAGTQLPTVRQLADDLGLAANTVARAYRELEAAGLVETRGRGGTVVSAAGDVARTRVQQAAQAYATVVHDLGLNHGEAVELVRAALDRPPHNGERFRCPLSIVDSRHRKRLISYPVAAPRARPLPSSNRRRTTWWCPTGWCRRC